MRRRKFIVGASILGIGTALAGCQSLNSFSVKLLKGSVPPQILQQFRQELSESVSLQFLPQPQLQQLFEGLQTSSLSPDTTDLVMIGDYWLTQAIQQNLIQPLNPDKIEQWSQLPQPWQQLVTRNSQGEIDTNGQVWAAPYRWGSTVLVYRMDKFKALGWTPQDWKDLWQPELRDRISLLNQPREVIGLTLKKLGQSYNTTDLNAVTDLKSELQQLHQNVKLYDSTTYLKPLVLGDTWLAVGWSTDIPLQLQRQYNLGVVVPTSGTALWSEVWVKPRSASSTTEPSLADQWISFCWTPEIAQRLSLLTEATSPIVTGMTPDQLLPEWKSHPVLLPSAAILDQSELLLPLPETTLEQYRRLWQTLRRS